MSKMFGQSAKKARLKMGKTLRAFCLENKLDPSYWSRVERGYAYPPSSQEALESLGRALGVSGPHMEHWKAIAALSRGSYPQRILESEELCKKMPLFMAKITPEKLAEFVEDLKKLH